ncbi:MAG: hypothetical protein AMS18_01910 [Gemmatimonas sp. SG8_17]|nr:MAG: hypothetical protein AMS18_01910 [Gemmatimonas sp. SG8_17]
MHIRTLLIAGVLALVACASSRRGASTVAGTQTIAQLSGDIEAQLIHGTAVSSHSVGAGVMDAWGALPAVYDSLRVPIAVVDTVNMRLGTGAFQPSRIGGKRLSRYLDCGRGMTGANADTYGVTISLVTWVSEQSGGGTQVHTAIQASAKARDVNSYPVNCSSKGVLEMEIAELVAEVLRNQR